jgi:hypothetical protein
MSIRQNLTILNKPISELAMLPQETIMTMAQSGQIPVAFVAPILAEKAEASQRAVEAEAMMAQEQMPPGSVIEKIIAQNAANETQANMPMMAPPMPEAQDNMPMMGAQMSQMSQMSQMPQPEDVGIGALPIPDEMIPGLAGGGIIAFQNRGLVEDEVDLNEITRGIDAASGIDSLNSGEVDLNEITRGIDAASGRNLTGKFSGLGEEAQVLAEERNRFLGPNQSVADLIAYNKEAEERADRRAKSQFNTRLIEAGLLGLSGDSPYFGVNLGKMAPAVKGMSEDTEKQAEAKEARKKSELAAKGIERKEGEASFSQALAQRTAEFEADAKIKAARIAAGKPTDMRNYVNDKELADRGDQAAARRVKAVEKYLPLATEARTGVAAEAVDVQRGKVSGENLKAAKEFVAQQIAYGGGKRKQYNDLLKQDRANEKAGNPTKLADEFEKQLVKDFLAELETQSTGGAKQPAAAKSAAALPSGIPPGSKQVGTSGGKPVYELPDGTQVIQQ